MAPTVAAFFKNTGTQWQCRQGVGRSNSKIKSKGADWSSPNTKKASAGMLKLFVGLLGFEPRQTESKSVVLPLHHNPN